MILSRPQSSILNGLPIFVPHLKKVLSFLISVEIIFGGLPARAQKSTAPSETQNSPTQNLKENFAEEINNTEAHWALLAPNPFLEKFRKVSESSPPLQLKFSPNDPALDRDPYFLRSQEWKDPSPELIKQSTATDFQTLKTQSGIEIKIPEKSKSLHIKVPLSLIKITDDFLFFSLDKTSDIFKKASNANVPTSGVFFISRDELEDLSDPEKPVPIFFMPLSPDDWGGPVVAEDIEIEGSPDPGTVNFTNIYNPDVDENEKVLLSVDLEDVNTIMSSERLMLSMAIASSAKYNLSQSIDLIYPAPGSTYGFGTIFTGLNLNDLSQSFWNPNSNNNETHEDQKKDQAVNYDEQKKTISWWTQLAFKKLINKNPLLKSSINHLLPKSNALELSDQMIYDLWAVMGIIGGMIVLSAVLKYKHPLVRRKLEALRPEKIENMSKKQRFRLNLKEISYTLAAVTTTSIQIPTVTLAYAVELFADKFFPNSAGEHAWLRRGLNSIFFLPRDMSLGNPVTERLFFFGALLGGTLVLANSTIQFLFVIPFILQALDSFSNEYFHHLITDAYVHHKDKSNSVAFYETVRGFLSKIQKGASDLSSDSRMTMISRVMQTTTRELRLQLNGRRPTESQRKAYFDKEMNRQQVALGYPGPNKFLFDYGPVIQSLFSSLGYRISEDLKNKDKHDKDESSEGYILTKRPALLTEIVERALKQSYKNAKESPSEVSFKVVEICEDANRRLGLITNGLLRGPKGIKEVIEFKEMMTMLLYEGKIGWIINRIPDTWISKYGEEAANAASFLMRQSLYSLLDRRTFEMLSPKPENKERFKEEASKIAFVEMVDDEMKKRWASTGDLDLDDHHRRALVEEDIKNNLSKKSYQLYLRRNKEITSLAKKEEEKKAAESFTPPAQDSLARRQHEKAVAYANKFMARSVHNNTFDQGRTDVTDESRIQEWKERYLIEYTRQLGLHIETHKEAKEADDAHLELHPKEESLGHLNLLRSVENIAREQLEHDLNSPGMEIYLSKLTNEERNHLITRMYSEHFALAYVQETTVNGAINPLDPQQPGRLQWFRRKLYPLTIKSPRTQVDNKIITRLLSPKNAQRLYRGVRIAEFLVDDQAAVPGWHGWMRRNLPFFNDLYYSHGRVAKAFIPGVTAIYLWNKYVLFVNQDYSTFVLIWLMTASLSAAPQQGYNRLYRMNGWKQIDISTMQSGFISITRYMLPLIWLTSISKFPLILYANSFHEFFVDNIYEPFRTLMDYLPYDTMVGLTGTLAVILAIQKAIKMIEEFERHHDFVKFKERYASSNKTSDFIEKGAKCQLLFSN